jgi:hypothetical protein
MIFSRIRNPYKAELNRVAKMIPFEEAEREEMLKVIVASAGATAGTLTVAAASLKAASLGKAAALAKLGGTVATVAAVAALGVSGAALSLMNPVHIQGIAVHDAANLGSSSLVITTDSPLPPQSVRVYSDSGAYNTRRASLSAFGKYTATVTRNGLYTVEVVNTNGEIVTSEIRVEHIDEDYPVMTAYLLEEDGVHIYFSDDYMGVDWNSISARDESGNTVAPLGVYPEQGSALFPLPEGSLSVRIADVAGNEIVAVVTAD